MVNLSKAISKSTFFFLRKNKFLRALFKIISMFFSSIVFLRNKLYDWGLFKPYKLPAYCISVGNLSLGGSGKSPFLLFLIEELLKKGYRIALLTRGYKSGISKKEVVLLEGGAVSFLKGKTREVFPDEALMYSFKFPSVSVLVSPSRREAARLFLEKNRAPDIWLLDDGFQHRKIARDLDLVLHDVSLDLEDKVFPAGFLREPFSSLKRCDVLVATHPFEEEMEEKIFSLKKNLRREASFFHLEFQNEEPRSLCGSFTLQKGEGGITLLCGIASPEKFLAYAKKEGFFLQKRILLADHEPLKKEHKKLLLKAKKILITEKDYYRDKTFFDQLSCPVYISKFLVNRKKIRKLI